MAPIFGELSLVGEEQINRYMINIYNTEKYIQYAIENTKKVTNLLSEIRDILV